MYYRILLAILAKVVRLSHYFHAPVWKHSANLFPHSHMRPFEARNRHHNYTCYVQVLCHALVYWQVVVSTAPRIPRSSFCCDYRDILSTTRQASVCVTRAKACPKERSRKRRNQPVRPPLYTFGRRRSSHDTYLQLRAMLAHQGFEFG